MNCSALRNECVLIAAGDMRGYLIAVVVVLALGVAVLRAVAPASGQPKPRRWLAIAAFICGPIAALAFLAADILWMQPHNYLIAQDYFDTLKPALIIGLFGGAIGAAAIWSAECVSCCQLREQNTGSQPTDEPEQPKPDL